MVLVVIEGYRQSSLEVTRRCWCHIHSSKETHSDFEERTLHYSYLSIDVPVQLNAPENYGQGAPASHIFVQHTAQ